MEVQLLIAEVKLWITEVKLWIVKSRWNPGDVSGISTVIRDKRIQSAKSVEKWVISSKYRDLLNPHIKQEHFYITFYFT